MSLSPPTAGFEWQAAQETSLKTGPSPSLTSSSSVNSPLPSKKRTDKSFVRLANGSPNVGLLSAVTFQVRIPTSDNEIINEDALNFIPISSPYLASLSEKKAKLIVRLRYGSQL